MIELSLFSFVACYFPFAIIFTLRFRRWFSFFSKTEYTNTPITLIPSLIPRKWQNAARDKFCHRYTYSHTRHSNAIWMWICSLMRSKRVSSISLRWAFAKTDFLLKLMAMLFALPLSSLMLCFFLVLAQSKSFNQRLWSRSTRIRLASHKWQTTYSLDAVIHLPTLQTRWNETGIWQGRIEIRYKLSVVQCLYYN